jgi:hypothetical protein
MELTNEQIQTLVEAVNHYKYHHVCINSSRFDELSHIVDVLTKQKNNEDIS